MSGASPTTASLCAVDATTGSHEFTVSHYSRLKRLGPGHHAMSSSFRVGGHDWTVRLFPAGYCSGLLARFVAAGLYIGDPHDPATADFIVSILDGRTGAPRFACGLADKVFDHTKSNHVVPCFVRGARLQASPCLRDDCVTVRCTVTVLERRPARLVPGPDAVQPVPSSEYLRNQLLLLDSGEDRRLARLVQGPNAAQPVPSGEYLRNQLWLLESGEAADVTFDVSGTPFRAHRCILAAQSPVFRAELLGPMWEGRAGHVKIEDMKPATFRALLHFVYGEALPAGEHLATPQELLVAADRYGLARLKSLCEEELCEGIDVETVATAFGSGEAALLPRAQRCLRQISPAAREDEAGD